MAYTLYKQKSKTTPLWLKILSGVFVVFLVLAMCFVFYCNVILEYHPVLGKSMYPTLNPNNINEDYVYSIQTSDVERGDIIIYNAEDEDSEERLVIKRLVALGGDYVQVRHNGEIVGGELIYEIRIKINGVGEWIVVDDWYNQSKALNYSLYTKLYYYNLDKKTFGIDENGEQYLIVPENCFFALGDNRVISYDCGSYGAVSMNKIHGKVMYVVYGNKTPYLQVLGQMFGGKKWK